MKQNLLIFVMCFVLVAHLSMAQERTVSGTVTTLEEGLAIPGVNVVLKGTANGTITDVDGNYKLTLTEGGGTLIFSFVGLLSQEIIVGSRSVVDVQLASDVSELQEVVVTALGISRDKASLGYAVSTVGSDQIDSRPEANIGNLLRGKVSGVDITSTSGLSGSGTNIIIRGYSSITGDNQPLFIVDGVPFNTDTNNDRGFSTGGATASSRFLDLDPNNIAEISILKGLSATVLYGEAGRNGVVLVTTKNGSSLSANKGLEVTLTQSVFANEAASIPDDQDKYGNGWQNFAAAAFSNWGAPFDQPGRNGIEADGTITHPYDRAALNTVFPQYDDCACYQYKPYDNLQQFFDTGVISNTSLNIGARIGDNSTINLNYAYLADDGFVPNKRSNLRKHNFGVGGRTKLENGLMIAPSFNFITSDRNAPPAGIIFSSNPAGSSLFSNVLYTPRSVDLFGLEYENPIDNTSIFYRGGNDIQHPLWTLNNSNDEEKVRRFFGSITMSYGLTDWLNVSYRVGLDTYIQQKRYTINKGGRQIRDGLMQTSQRLNFIQDHNFNFNFDRDLTSSLNLTGVLGANLKRETIDRTFTNSTNQFIYGLFTHGNFIDHTSFSTIREENTIGVYGSFSLGYNDYLYLNLQGRNDLTSTLEEDNRSIFYPSASLSVLPLDALSLQSDMLNFLKVRFGYGTSAGYPNPYQTRSVLATIPNAFIKRDGTVLNFNSVSDRSGNPDLKPEIHRELELGIEGRFLNDQVGLDLSLYKKTSEDLIIDLDLDPSTGFTNTTVNSAEIENQGIEVMVNIKPIVNNNTIWSITGNFTSNKSEVISLAPGIDQILIDGYTTLGNYAIPGEPYGVIQSDMVLRDDNGEPIMDAIGVYQPDPEIGITADPNPDFTVSVINQVSWKWITFRFQFDYQEGGDIYGATASTLYSRGILEETDFDRFVPVVVKGVKDDGTPNDFQITSNNHFWRDAGVFISENRMFDATHFRLREISLSFDAPKSLLANLPFGSASLTFSGQNLWYDAINFPNSANFDPEVLSLGVGNGRGFDFVTGPTSKKYGVTLRFTF